MGKYIYALYTTYRDACSHNFIEEKCNQKYLEIGVLKTGFCKFLKLITNLFSGKNRTAFVRHKE